MDATRREFIAGAAALAAGTAVGDASAKCADGIRIKFLGTGAADWHRKPNPKPDGELRRRASALLDGRILIDFTSSSMDMLGDAKPEVIFYTHSHNDHYDAAAATRIGVKKAYMHVSWADFAKKQFAAEAARQGRPQVEVVPVEFFKPVVFDGYEFTHLPANHSCDRPEWDPGVWTVKKGGTHLLYATDTAYFNDKAWVFYVMKQPPFTAIIHEATMFRKDTRITGHSSVDMVQYFISAVLYREFYKPPKGQKVYLTHLSRNSHKSQKELDATLPDPLVAAYDGLEITLS